jgi:hypothetical protein
LAVNYYVRAVPERLGWVDELREQIPTLEALVDGKRDAMGSFLSALRVIGEEAAVLLEDDIVLTADFCAKIEAVIAQRPNEFITFFNLSKKYTYSRHEPGSKFCMTQCIYLPAGWAQRIADWYLAWPQREVHPTGYDLLIADWMKWQRKNYYVHCPSLVQHRDTKSIIDPRRSRGRQSITFVA